ncbi:hypothetical protein QTP88_022284 [Uroleucon formosanum]
MLQQLYSFVVCDIALPFLFIYVCFYHLRLCPPHHDPATVSLVDSVYGQVPSLIKDHQ